ncbi:MAG: hypothetical protein KF760_22115 [Candidatus Eremiobacteraeota bacterium]|nr:hypothetical protein [Candidatus Eremiobacteraeota bacterium]MCW5872023.1 hypothetical protein [Candidatus Eremiobacteraeota bacterium]
MDVIGEVIDLINNPRIRRFTGDRRKQQLLEEATQDSILEKIPEYPRWSRLAAEHPMTRVAVGVGTDLGVV